MLLHKTPLTAAALLGLTTALMSVATTASAAPSECGGTYTIKSGDSLSKIASAVYGSARDFQIIFSANADVIGSNPGLIEVGMELDIPCLDGSGTSSANTDAIAVVTSPDALPAPNEREIRVVAGTGWAPFTNEDQEQGGMITEIINVALDQADGNPDYKIDFINDWGAHLSPLISDHAYDFSIAWFQPNCEIVDRLSEDSQFRCNNLDWSEPMFEQIFGYYTRASATAPATHADLMGKTICRPSGYATFMLEEHDLAEPNITLVRPSDPTECFNGLANGTFDAVAMAVDAAEGFITETGVGDEITYNENLSQVLTIHAVIAKTNPMADQYVAQLNSGINKMKDSGEWFSIIRRHLTAHRALTQ